MVQTVAGRFEMTGLKTGDDLKGLPTTLAQWKRFKVVVLGDLDASFVNVQQQKDLEQAVRDGTGLLMIGGTNSFAPGGWDKTTLATVLPVSLEKVTPAQINTAFIPQLTSVGAAHPIFRNIASYFLTPEGRKGQRRPGAGAVGVCGVGDAQSRRDGIGGSSDGEDRGPAGDGAGGAAVWQGTHRRLCRGYDVPVEPVDAGVGEGVAVQPVLGADDSVAGVAGKSGEEDRGLSDGDAGEGSVLSRASRWRFARR